MWLTAELLLALWVLLGGWWLWRRGPAGCLSTGVGLLIIYGSAVLAAWLTGLALGLPAINRWLQLLATCLAGTVTLILVARWWKPRGERLRVGWTKELDGSCRGHAVQAGVLGGWLAAHLIAWVLLANLVVAAYPEAHGAAHQRSLFTARLLGTPAGTGWERTLSEQQQHLLGLGSGVDRLLDATGTRQVMELMDAIGWISRLESDERARLVAASPELGRLVHEPTLLAVLDDARLMDLMDEAVHGSLPAAYALGAEPAVAALIDSPAMRAAIRAVDPVALRRQAALAGDGLTIAWQQAAISTSLDLDAQLASPAGWVPANGDVLAWEMAPRFGVARSTLPEEAGARVLAIAATAECSCWFAGRLLRPERRGALREFALPATAGELVLMFDFAGMDTPSVVMVTLRQVAPAQGDSGQKVL